MLWNSVLGSIGFSLIGLLFSTDLYAQSPAPSELPERHVACTTSRVQGGPDPPPPYTTEPWVPELNLKHAIFAAAEPGRSSLLIALHQTTGPKPSRIVRIADSPSSAQMVDTILELPTRVIYSFTFHPQYQQNGFIYVGSNGPLEQDERTDRVSRFTIKADGKVDPDSELIVLEWRSMGHDGLGMVFGQDGMFYVTSGDGTSDSDAWLSAQDVTNLCGSVMRIDVDHPTPERPYTIPTDNPFLHLPQARGELWAIGLRNPWRMCVDKKSGQIWVGNNGQDLWESVHLIRRGENYGWSVYEGGHPFYPNRPMGQPPTWRRRWSTIIKKPVPSPGEMSTMGSDIPP